MFWSLKEILKTLCTLKYSSAPRRIKNSCTDVLILLHQLYWCRRFSKNYQLKKESSKIYAQFDSILLKKKNKQNYVFTWVFRYRNMHRDLYRHIANSCDYLWRRNSDGVGRSFVYIIFCGLYLNTVFKNRNVWYITWEIKKKIVELKSRQKNL